MAASPDFAVVSISDITWWREKPPGFDVAVSALTTRGWCFLDLTGYHTILNGIPRKIEGFRQFIDNPLDVKTQFGYLDNFGYNRTHIREGYRLLSGGYARSSVHS